MKTPITRAVPPPIDLSASGSNITQAKMTATGEGTRTALVVGINHPYACCYAVDTGTPPTLTPTATPSPNTPNPFPSSGSHEDLISNWDNSRLVPNRRRRSYSASGYLPLSAPPSSHFSSSHSPASIKSGSSSSSLGLKQETKEVPEGNSSSRSRGKRNKLWLFVRPLSASAVVGVDAGSPVNNQRKKQRRPGTSSSTASIAGGGGLFKSDERNHDDDGGGGGGGGGWNMKKRHRPGTASSATLPWRTSKLEWQWQWKRLSPLRPSSSSLSLSRSDSGGGSTPSTPRKVPTDSQSVGTRTPTKMGKVPNRSTPNLQAAANLQATPNLSREDWGKINALYAPPPPARAVEAALSHHRISPSSKQKILEQKPVMPVLRCAVPKQTAMDPQERLSRLACQHKPLSPIGSIGGGDGLGEEEARTIYLTVEDDCDVGNGEAMLRRIEFPTID